jgi:hypothetical protein
MDLTELGRILGSYTNILTRLSCRSGLGWYIMAKEGLTRSEAIDLSARYSPSYSKSAMAAFTSDINSMYAKRHRTLICLSMPRAFQS